MEDFSALADPPPKLPEPPDFSAYADDPLGHANAVSSANAYANPTQAVQAAKIGRQMGIPPSAVETDLPNFQAQATAQKNVAILNSNPVLARWVSAYPDAAKMARDDYDNLSGIQNAVKYLFSAPGAPRGGLVADVGKAAQSMVSAAPGYIGAGTYGALAAPFGVLGQVTGITGPEEWLLQKQKDAVAVSNQWAPHNQATGTEGAIWSGFQSAGQSLMTLPLAAGSLAVKGFTASGEAIMLGVMGLTTGGKSYGKAREEGVDPAKATMYAAEDLAAEVIGEKYLGQAGLVKLFKAKASVAKLLLYEMTTEIKGEVMTTLWQNFNEWANLNPDKPMSQFIAEQPEAIRQTIIATLVGGGAQIGAVKIAQKALDSIQPVDNTAALQAQEAAANLKTIFDLASKTNLATSKEDFSTMLGELAPDASVRFDARILYETLQQSGMTVAELNAALPSLDNLAEQVISGGEASIPMSEFVTGVMGTKLEEPLQQHARIGTNELSQAEAVQAIEKAGDLAKQNTERIVAQAEDAATARLEQAQIQQSIAERLDKIEAFPKSVNNALANHLTNFYATYGPRAGMTAAEFEKANPVSFLKAVPDAKEQKVETVKKETVQQDLVDMRKRDKVLESLLECLNG